MSTPGRGGCNNPGGGSSPGCSDATASLVMPEDGNRTPRTGPGMLRTPRALTPLIPWAFTSELQSVQKSVEQHDCDLKQLESKVCGLQRRLTESSNRIDALEVASAAMTGKPSTPCVAELCHNVIVSRLDTLSVSITELEARFEIFKVEMANVAAASASKVDSIQDKLGGLQNVSSDDLQVCLANASNHVKRLEKLSERWKAHQNKEHTNESAASSQTQQGSVDQQEPFVAQQKVSVPPLVAQQKVSVTPAHQKRDVIRMERPAGLEHTPATIVCVSSVAQWPVATCGATVVNVDHQAHHRKELLTPERTGSSLENIVQQELYSPSSSTWSPKGSLHLEESMACAGAGHVHNLRVAASAPITN